MQNFRKKYQAYIELAERFYTKTILAVILLMLATIIEGFGISIIFPLIESLLNNDVANDEFIFIYNLFSYINMPASTGWYMFIIASALILKSILTLFFAVVIGNIQVEIIAKLRHELLAKTVLVNWKYFIKAQTGKLINAYTLEISKAASLHTGFCRIVAYSAQAIIYVALAALISPVIAIGSVLVSVFMFVIFKFLIKRSRNAGERQTETLKNFSNRMIDVLKGMKLLKTMNLESQILPYLNKKVEEVKYLQARLIIYKELMSAGQTMVMVVVLTFGIYMAIDVFNESTGKLFVLAALFFRTTQSLSIVQKQIQGMSSNEAAFWYLKDMNNELDSLIFTHHLGKKISFDKKIELKKINLSYSSHEVYSNLDFEIRCNDFVVIMGPSGAGKTSLIDIITGLISPDFGTIFVDGISITENNCMEWRNNIGYVPQETFLFNDTIKMNITLGDNTYSDNEIIDSLKQADIWDHVRNSEDGIYTAINEGGSNLSGGQKQRIAIARALLRKPDLLILDEATASLDKDSENEILKTLKKIKGETTIIAITHHDPLIKLADHLYEVKDANVYKVEIS